MPGSDCKSKTGAAGRSQDETESLIRRDFANVWRLRRLGFAGKLVEKPAGYPVNDNQDAQKPVIAARYPHLAPSKEQIALPSCRNLVPLCRFAQDGSGRALGG